MSLFRKESKFDQPIDAILVELRQEKPDSEKYTSLLAQLDRLTQLKDRERINKVSADTAWMVAGNLIGILIIVAYEQKHIIGSRGVNFILRPRTP